MRKFPCALCSVETFPHMNKEEALLLESCKLVWPEFFYITTTSRGLNI